MKITFDLYNTGLGNNGGSRTLLLCAEAMSSLGHDVTMFSNIKSRYTWHKVKKNINFIYEKVMPPTDLVISTSPKSVNSTVKSKARNKVYYIRGYEIFWCSEKLVQDGYNKLKCVVNSEWLQRKLFSLGVNSDIVYPGLDFDLFSNVVKKRENIIGGLYHKRLETKKHKQIDLIAKNMGSQILMLNRDICSPSPEELKNFYNRIKVWVAPTELEGLHNPPMEASLCGCGLVATDHERSGMSDYAIHKETAFVYPCGNTDIAEEFILLFMNDDKLREKMNKNMVELLRNKIGMRKENMKRMIEISTS